MGQIKNIKLHIVTDIKFYLQTRSQNDETTAIFLVKPLHG